MIDMVLPLAFGMKGYGGVQTYTAGLLKHAPNNFRLSLIIGRNQSPLFPENLRVFKYDDSAEKQIKQQHSVLWPLRIYKQIRRYAEDIKEFIDKNQSCVYFCQNLIAVLAVRRLHPQALIVFFPGSSLFVEKQMALNEMPIISKYRNTIPIISKYRHEYLCYLRLLWYLERRAFLQADLVFVASNFFKRDILSRFRVKSDNIDVLPLGVSTPRSLDNRNRQSPLKILCVSRLVEVKNVGLLLEVAKRLGPKVTWGIVGDGQEMKNLKQKAIDMGIADLITFYGRVKKEQIPYHEFDMLFHPSKYENFGLVFLEANSYGLPVIALTPEGREVQTASDEIIREGINGFLVPPAPDEIARKIESLCYEEIENMRNSCKKIVSENYTDMAHYAKLFDKLEEIHQKHWRGRY